MWISIYYYEVFVHDMISVGERLTLDILISMGLFRDGSGRYRPLEGEHGWYRTFIVGKLWLVNIGIDL